MSLQDEDDAQEQERLRLGNSIAATLEMAVREEARVYDTRRDGIDLALPGVPARFRETLVRIARSRYLLAVVARTFLTEGAGVRDALRIETEGEPAAGFLNGVDYLGRLVTGCAVEMDVPSASAVRDSAVSYQMHARSALKAAVILDEIVAADPTLRAAGASERCAEASDVMMVFYVDATFRILAALDDFESDVVKALGAPPGWRGVEVRYREWPNGRRRTTEMTPIMASGTAPGEIDLSDDGARLTCGRHDLAYGNGTKSAPLLVKAGRGTSRESRLVLFALTGDESHIDDDDEFGDDVRSRVRTMFKRVPGGAVVLTGTRIRGRGRFSLPGASIGPRLAKAEAARKPRKDPPRSAK